MPLNAQLAVHGGVNTHLYFPTGGILFLFGYEQITTGKILSFAL